MKPTRLLSLLTLSLAALIVASAPAWASPYPEANLYFGVRDRLEGGPILDATPLALQTDFLKLNGKVLEIRGQVKGILGLEDGAQTILIGNDEATWMIEFPLATEEAPAIRPPRPEERIRLLVRVVPYVENARTGKLALIVFVLEWQAKKVDASRAKTAAARPQPTNNRAVVQAVRQRGQIKDLASRGVTPNLYRPVYQSSTLTEQEIVRRYTDAILSFNKRLGRRKAESIARSILYYSRKNGMDARLVMAVIATESNFNEKAVSRAGARGLGQLMPGTARGLGVKNSFDPNQNLDGATRLLRQHLGTFSRKTGYLTLEAIELALACYNAGAGAVNKYKGIPPYRETKNYIRKVTRLYLQMAPELRPYLQKR